MEPSERKIFKVEDDEKIEEEEEEGKPENSVLDSIIDLMPFEMHVPGYKFCGPGTKLAEQLERGDVGINPLDEACREHDKAYADKKINRRQADQILAEKAFSRMLGGETPPDERTVAMMTACCMVSKITFEKFFSRIKKAIKCRDKKTKKSKVGKRAPRKDEEKKNNARAVE